MRRQRAGLSLGFAIPVIAAAFLLVGADSAPRGPAQPIAFPHDTHVGQYGMSCYYCHYTADRSPWVNIAPVELCMGCHKITAADRPEIQKLARYWTEKKPIPWVRVHHLPEHAKFNHKRHVKAGVECQYCHGPVEQMKVVYQYSSLSMDWCVSCHNGDNQYGLKASVDCFTCHY